mmetsp:Transcript_101453/g.160420  ORF Transcript_101453/g.160420 Transcript_101453/m.160420 type:complete len:166 (+) Transcript_101453:72-569(+)
MGNACASRKKGPVDADANLQAEEGENASSSNRLLKMAEEDDTDGIKELLEKRANPNVSDKTCGYHTTPLLLAIRNGYIDTAETLIDARADVNLAGAWNYTPLMYAAIWKQPLLASYLLQAKADATAKDVKGETALQHAIGEQQQDIADIIQWSLNAKERDQQKKE